MKCRCGLLSLTVLLLLSVLLCSSPSPVLAHGSPHRLGQITEYPLSPNSGPVSIVRGPDGNLWFTQFDAGNLGHINPQTGQVTLLGDPGFSPYGITVGPDHNLWISEYFPHQIERLTLDGHFTTFYLPDGIGNPAAIKAGSDGNIWFTIIGYFGQPSYLGRVTLQEQAQGQITLFKLPNPKADPEGLVANVPDGKVWFTESLANAIGTFDPKTGKLSEYPLGPSWPNRMTLGPDGNLWFTEYLASKIGRLNPNTGQVTHFALPDGFVVPEGIAVGSDQHLWFTESRMTANKIGRISLDGHVSSYAIPTPSSGPLGITAGPSNTMWFCEGNASQIGKITTR